MHQKGLPFGAFFSLQTVREVPAARASWSFYRTHRDRYVIRFWIAYYYIDTKKVSCQMIVRHRRQDTFFCV